MLDEVVARVVPQIDRKVGAELSPKKREQLLAYMNRGFAKFGVGSTTTVQDADRPYHVMSETDLEHQLRGAQAIEDQVNATASAAAIRDRQRQVVLSVIRDIIGSESNAKCARRIHTVNKALKESGLPQYANQRALAVAIGRLRRRG